MTEHDKLALLSMLNKSSEALQHVIAAEEKYGKDFMDYSKLKSLWNGIIHEFERTAESNGCKVIWEGNQAVKIVEKGE
jgi:hypothetical protein